MTCAKTQGFLAKNKLETATVVDAKKATIKGEKALDLLSGVDELYATKGKQVIHFDLRKGKPPKPELLAAMLGPTGNLRAPTIRKGKTLLIGFDEATYRKLLK
ncbi:MAG: hypothetical protein L0027_13680 [Candidatus Rokubacteria bacterium]|nr:hypothetical protein [Candidatus Rokubacteria bacterium]